MRLASGVVAVGCVIAVTSWLALPTRAAEVPPVFAQPPIVFALPCDGGSGHQSHRRTVHIGAFVVHLHVTGGIGQAASAGFALVLDPARVSRSKTVSAFAPSAERCKARPHFADLSVDTR